jgi:hypothetical protein
LPNRRSPLVALALTVVLLGALLPSHAAAATTWRYNLYRSSGYLTQDPYSTACTAAAVMMMLNFIDLTGGGGDGFTWRTSRVKNSRSDYRDMLSILYFERAHDTLSAFSHGSDAHGWRNALNNYGWGAAAMTDATKRVYDDKQYGSFDSAVKAAVVAIAKYHMPVGMLGWAGGHAQVITGYLVTGDNPAESTNFTVNGVYLSDPLYKDHIINKLIGLSQLRSGSPIYRFQAYREIDSPYDDGYSAGWRRSSVRSMTSEWYRRWVLIMPIRSGLGGDPDPNPTPTPTPTPTPDPTPTPTPSASSVSNSAPDSKAAQPSSEATPTPSPTPTPTSAETPAASSAPSPSSAPPASNQPDASATPSEAPPAG